MAKCVKCGKKGLFLKLNYFGVCADCERAEEVRKKMIEQIKREGVAIDATVAGVTFNTGNKSRQTILRQIYFKDPPFEKKPKITLEKYKYENEDAVGVFANGVQVGSIARKNLPWVLKYWDHNLRVSTFKVYGGYEHNWGMSLELKADSINL